jgi:flagellar FliL protein
MSAAAQVAEAIPAPPAKGKKKLIIVVAAALLVTTLVGGGTVFVLKKKAAAAAAVAADDDTPAAHGAASKHDPSHVPTFLPLEPFVVNLADKDADRYAQIGVTLEIDDPKFAEQLKAYMPAIRNGILMVLAHKTSGQLLDRAGKLALADEIMREAVRPLGIEIAEAAAEPEEKSTDESDDDGAKAKKKPRKKKAPAEHNPVRHVHFSNFIIQ